MLLSRRDLIGMTVRAAAAAGGADFFAAWLRQGATHQHPSSPAPPEPPRLRNYQPKLFSLEDFEALQAFPEIMR